jgi:hypothetical protein
LSFGQVFESVRGDFKIKFPEPTDNTGLIRIA